MIGVIVLFFITAILSACQNSTLSVSSDNNEDGEPVINVSAQNVSDSAGNGYLAISGDESLVISPLLNKGYFQVEVRKAGTSNNIALNERIEGKVMNSYELESGEYEFIITGKNGATGTMLIFAQDKAELDAQNKALNAGTAVTTAAPEPPASPSASTAPVQPSTPGNLIGEEKAKTIALSDAGLTEQAVENMKCELDNDNGKQKYEIEFICSGIEYEYDVDALTGSILKTEKEQK